MVVAGVLNILAAQWRAHWRQVGRQGTAAKSNLVVLALIALAGSDQYLKFVRGAAQAWGKGQDGPLDLLLAAAMLACALPIWGDAGMPVTARGLARFPLRATQRFGVHAGSRFIAPFSWILAAACAGVFWPLRGAWMGIVAAVLLLAGSIAVGMMIENTRATEAGRRVVGGAAWGLAVVAAVLWRENLAAHALSVLPSHAVIEAARGSWIAVAVLASAACAMLWAAISSEPWMLEQAPARAAAGKPKIAATTLFRKELRYLTRTAEERLVWLILILFCFYLATAQRPEPDALHAVLAVFSLFTMSAAMNSFGMDGAQALDRYALTPVRGRQVLAAKNLAFLATVSARAVPALALAAWRMGWREAAFSFTEAASLGLATLAWGNVTSVRHPSRGDSGVILDQLVGFAAAAGPGAMAILIGRGAPDIAPYAMAALAAVCAALYFWSLAWAGGYVERRLDVMRERLS